MKRLLSILLLAAFALPLVAPLLAVAQDPEAGLPACCRRHGLHHCTMLDSVKNSSVHRIVSVCPACPQRAVPASTLSRYLIIPAAVSTAPPPHLISSSPGPHARAVHRIAHLHPKRGPPANSFATT